MQQNNVFSLHEHASYLFHMAGGGILQYGTTRSIDPLVVTYIFFHQIVYLAIMLIELQ